MHPQNWCWREHGVRGSSVIINLGCGPNWRCLHPWNLLHVGVSGRCCGVLKAVGSCLQMSVCCSNNLLQVLCSLRISAFARHALYSFDAAGQCMHHFVGMGDGGIGDVLVLELNMLDSRLLLVRLKWQLGV